MHQLFKSVQKYRAYSIYQCLMGHWFQATFALLSIDIDTHKKYLRKMHKIWIINTTYNANLMKHQQGISLLVPWFHSVFSLVSNWRILQHASHVLSKSAPNVYYGQNASMAAGVQVHLLYACTLLASRPRCSLVALAVRLSPSQVAPRSLPLAGFPSLVAPRSSPLAVFPSPLNVPPGIPYALYPLGPVATQAYYLKRLNAANVADG